MTFLPFRRMLGVEKILQSQRHAANQLMLLRTDMAMQKQQLMRLTSLVVHSVIIPDKARSTETYQACREYLTLLTPMEVAGINYVRLGKHNDGGYVMLDNFGPQNTQAAYSFGIDGDVSWDLDVAKRELDVFMYDHTIATLPQQSSRFRFFRLGITGSEKSESLRTLAELLQENGHEDCNNLIMKMDVEGCEWDVFEHCSSSTIAKFSQIVIELHGLDPAADPSVVSRKLSVLRKINETHQCVHVHANAISEVVWIDKMVLPSLLEVTYARRNDVADLLRVNSREFPTALDEPTFADGTDVVLGRFVPS